MNSVYTPPPSGFHQDEPPEDKGSLGLGIGLAWAIAVVGTPVSIGITVGARSGFNGLPFVLWSLPYVLIVVLAVLNYRKGKTRMGHGLLLGLLSIVAVALLLVAACFGMLSNLNAH